MHKNVPKVLIFSTQVFFPLENFSFLWKVQPGEDFVSFLYRGLISVFVLQGLG